MKDQEKLIEEIVENAEKLKITLKQTETYDDPAEFIRTLQYRDSWYYGKSGSKRPNQWKVLLAQDKRDIVTNSKSGFALTAIKDFPAFQTVTCTKKTETLLLSNDKESVKLANIILNSLAKEKYGPKK